MGGSAYTDETTETETTPDESVVEPVADLTDVPKAVADFKVQVLRGPVSTSEDLELAELREDVDDLKARVRDLETWVSSKR